MGGGPGVRGPRRGRAAARIRAARFLLLAATAAGVGSAAETDNLTYRYVPLAESAPAFDRIVNATLDAITSRANAALRAGERDPVRATDVEAELAWVEAYRDVVLRRFSYRLLPVFGACVESDDCPGWPRFERIVLTGRESFYDESRYSWFVTRSLAPTFRLCGVRIGTDKLTHLFSNGFFYWNASRREGARIRTADDALRFAIADEDGLMGARSTGVVSRADALATQAGYRLAAGYFEGDDPMLARGRRSGLLVRRREVDVCRFVTADWDEAIDPPVFTEGRRKRERVTAAIAERFAANARGDRLPEKEKKRLERELTARRLPPDHGKLSFPEELAVAVKWGFGYLTISRDGRRAVDALAFPKFRPDDRRPIRLMRVPD